MKNVPLKNYGFTYEFDGKEFSFLIVAESEEEARHRAAAMSGAAFVGEVFVGVVYESPATVASVNS